MRGYIYGLLIWAVLVFVMMLTSCLGKPYIKDVNLYGLMMVPKHERTFVQAQGVPRWDLRAEAAVDIPVDVKWADSLFYGVQGDLWGFQAWRDLRGYKWIDAVEASDYTVDKWKWTATQEFGVRFTDRVSWFNEYFISADGVADYYWLSGIRVKLR